MGGDRRDGAVDRVHDLTQVRVPSCCAPARDRLKLAAGVRYNYPNFGDSATVWDVSGRYQLPGDLFIQTLVGTAFRLPMAEELTKFARSPPRIEPAQPKPSITRRSAAEST
jgi:hypothetical protein